jgi:hypothetical protein
MSLASVKLLTATFDRSSKKHSDSDSDSDSDDVYSLKYKLSSFASLRMLYIAVTSPFVAFRHTLRVAICRMAVEFWSIKFRSDW